MTGLAAGHLAAAFVDLAASPVLAVGSLVIDLTPTPVKEWAVAHFGTADKPILLGSVLAITLVVTALIGVLARRHAVGATVLLALLVSVSGAATLLRPSATVASALPSVVALAIASAVLAWLTRLARKARDDSEPPKTFGRRTFVLASGGTALLATLAVIGGQLRARSGAVRTIVLPRPASAAPPLPVGLEATIPGVTPLQTPSDRFYRVDINLAVPRVDIDTWALEIDGQVERPLRLSFAEILAMPLIERDITLTCVSNEVGGAYVSSGRWLGVPVVELLDRVGVRGRPDQALSTAVDGFTVSTPLAALRDGRDAMVAVGLDGAPLPEEHGFPARLVTPGLYGFVGATKWLRRLTLTTYAAEQAYWTRRQWATDAPIKTSARIDVPAPLSTIRAGRVAVAGVAWAQGRGVGRVDVRIDDGPWDTAQLGPDIGVDCWRQWYLPWDATPGLHRLAVRATDLRGVTQPTTRATPFPNGASGIQQIVVTVD